MASPPAVLKRLIGCVLSLGAGALPGAASLCRAAAEPAPAVSFSLSRAEAAAGAKATLVLSIRTEVDLRAVSIALDFDETMMRALELRRLPGPLAGNDPAAVPPQDVASTSINNLDLKPGNQVEEGWIHIDLDAGTTLALTLGEETPILEIDFLVLPGAASGFAPVRFTTVGPVSAAPAAFFVNRFETAAATPAGKDLAPQSLHDGGIDIIGEVGFFRRGDTNFDRKRDITDPIVTLTYLFTGGVPLACADAADANDDGVLDVSDAIFTLSRLFESTESFPEPDDWGRDPTPDSLGCAVYFGQ
jgi:hypothetical protein